MGWDADVAPGLALAAAADRSRHPGVPRHSATLAPQRLHRVTCTLIRAALSLVIIATPIAAIAPFTSGSADRPAAQEDLRDGLDRLARGESVESADLGTEVRAAALSTGVVFGALGLTVAVGLLGGRLLLPPTPRTRRTEFAQEPLEQGSVER